MAITFTAPGSRNSVRNDQTVGLQTPVTIDTGTDVAFGDLAALDAIVQAEYPGTPTAFATANGGAVQANSMTVSSDGAITGIRFTDGVGGNGVLDGDDSGLDVINADGTLSNILLYADSTTPDTVVYGINEDSGAVVFVVQLVLPADLGSQAVIGYNVITYAPIFHDDGTDPDDSVDLGDTLRIQASDLSGLFDFSDLAATKFLYGVVGSTDGGFIVIGKDPAIKANGTPVNGMGAGDLINTSKGGGEVTIGVRNQHFTADSNPNTVEQGAYFTYTTGMAAGTYNDADDINISTLVSVETARLQVSQTQAAGTVPPSMRLTTLDYTLANGQAFVGDLTPADHGAQVDILTINIYDSDPGDPPVATIDVTTLVVGVLTPAGPYTVRLNADGSVDIRGLQQKDWVEWTTDGTHDRVLVEALSGKWDIGGFEIDQPSSEFTSVGEQIVFDDTGPAIGYTGGSGAIDGNLKVDGTTEGSKDSADLNEDGGSDGVKSIVINDFSGDGDGANGAAVVVGDVTLTAEQVSDTLVRYFHDVGPAGFDAGDQIYYTYELIDTGVDGIVDTAEFTVVFAPASPEPDFSLNDLPAGQNGFGMLASRADSDPTTPLDKDGPGLVIIGREPLYGPDGTFTNKSDTINTSKGGGPNTIGNSNQMIDPASNKDTNGEGVYFVYVLDPVDGFVADRSDPTGLTQNEADDFDNIQYLGGTVEADGAFFSVVQVQGNPKMATARITAFDMDNDDPRGTGAMDALEGRDLVDELFILGDPATRALGDASLVFVDEISINDGPAVLRSSGNTATVIWNADGSVDVGGILAGDTIHFNTDGDHDLALIDGIAGKFDIGDYGLDLFNPLPDKTLSFGVKITDNDMDMATDTHSVLIEGDMIV